MKKEELANDYVFYGNSSAYFVKLWPDKPKKVNSPLQRYALKLMCAYVFRCFSLFAFKL